MKQKEETRTVVSTFCSVILQKKVKTSWHENVTSNGCNNSSTSFQSAWPNEEGWLSAPGNQWNNSELSNSSFERTSVRLPTPRYPYFDPGTQILYTAGKGDSKVSLYEVGGWGRAGITLP